MGKCGIRIWTPIKKITSFKEHGIHHLQRSSELPNKKHRHTPIAFNNVLWFDPFVHSIIVEKNETDEEKKTHTKNQTNFTQKELQLMKLN